MFKRGNTVQSNPINNHKKWNYRFANEKNGNVCVSDVVLYRAGFWMDVTLARRIYATIDTTELRTEIKREKNEKFEKRKKDYTKRPLRSKNQRGRVWQAECPPPPMQIATDVKRQPNVVCTVIYWFWVVEPANRLANKIVYASAEWQQRLQQQATTTTHTK